MQVVVDALLTNYRLTGKGKLVVFLHGWGDSSQGSLALQSALAEHYQVLAFDLPGFGSSQTPPDVWGLSDYARFVRAAIRKLNLKPYAIIGHSNGGAIALRGLSDGSLEAQKLVLLASAGIRNEYNGRKYALRVAARTGKALTKPLPQRLRKKLQAKAYATIGSEMLIAEHLQESFKKIVSDDVQADAAGVTLPSLLIYGQHDTATPVHYGELFQAALPHSTLQVIPQAGHFVYLDQPARVTDLIEEFLR